MRLFAEKIQKNTLSAVILPQFTHLNAIFSETDYDTCLFSVEYEDTSEQEAGHCDVNKHHYTLSKPAVSASFKWTSKKVAGRADSTIYILAGKEP